MSHSWPHDEFGGRILGPDGTLHESGYRAAARTVAANRWQLVTRAVSSVSELGEHVTGRQPEEKILRGLDDLVAGIDGRMTWVTERAYGTDSNEDSLSALHCAIKYADHRSE